MKSNNMAIKSQFKGTPIVPKNVTFPEIGELRGDFGKEVLAEYNGIAEKDYGNARALKVLNYSDGVVKGSNPFAVVLVNSILPSGLRTSTPADLERALSVGIDLSGTYTDSALVLRNAEDPNKYLAGNITAQLMERGFKPGKTYVIPLIGLELATDRNSEQGIAFKLKEDAEVIPVSKEMFNSGGNFSNEDIDLNTGLPKKLGNGNRTLYTRENGLSGLYLNSSLVLNSNYGSLANLGGYGRVRVTSTSQGASVRKNSEQYLANLKRMEAEEIAGLKGRYAKAMKIVQGKTI
jgi:hypothetical protein